MTRGVMSKELYHYESNQDSRRTSSDIEEERRVIGTFGIMNSLYERGRSAGSPRSACTSRFRRGCVLYERTLNTEDRIHS